MSFHVIRPANVVLLSASLLVASSQMSRAAVSFEKQLLPVLDQKCLSCHKAPHEENGKVKKPKGELRLDAAWAILKGGENGPILKPKESAKSYMYEVVTLPKDDDKFMPPKGDPLTSDEIKLLKQWIDEGADFGGWEGNQEGRPADAPGSKPVAKVREHDELYKKLSEGLKPLPDAVIKKATEGGAQVAALQLNTPLVRADFLTGVSQCTDKSLEVLLPLKDNLAQLDLGRTKITDAGLKVIAQMPRLVTLDLRQTGVTDAGLAALAGLKNLHTLNLYGTQVSDAGLKSLAGIKSLRQIYLWQTKATEAGAKQLKGAIPSLEISMQ